jgi:serine/threonine-protein kinase RsbW
MKQELKTLKLKSLPESLNQLEHLIEEVCDQNNLNQTYHGCISIALTEAFENALHHGNKRNPEKTITVQFQKTQSGLQFRVQDEGEGFDYQSIPDLKEDGNAKVFPGRGTFLIKSLSDDLRYIGNGNELEISFKTSSIDFETAVDRMSKFKEYSESVQKVE